jgi:class 3 adenylate cyclase
MAPEERLVTVLFVDIRGYTAFAGDAVRSLATRVAAFHRWARAEIESEGGLVDKFAGDAVMATFNVVSPRLDHAPAALRAAIGIRDKAAAGGFSVGGGIAVGPAVVGALVAGGNVSAIGTPTNLAARLQAQAGGRQILLSGEAYRRIATWLHERGLTAQRRDLELKGFDDQSRPGWPPISLTLHSCGPIVGGGTAPSAVQPLRRDDDPPAPKAASTIVPRAWTRGLRPRPFVICFRCSVGAVQTRRRKGW